MTDRRRARLEAQRDQARRDLEELADQLKSGEMDPVTAARLRSIYEAEAADASSLLDALRQVPDEAPQTRSTRRTVVGTVLFAAGAAAVLVGVMQAVEPRPEGGFATGGIASEVSSSEGRDLADVSNEELEVVVAANPTITPMRLALARRYFEAGEFSRALDHYIIVLDEETHPEALAYVGWMSHLSGESELGARYLERSLDTAPDYPLALWFLAQVRVHGLGDPQSAAPVLERLLQSPDLPADLRAAAEELLTSAGTGRS